MDYGPLNSEKLLPTDQTIQHLLNTPRNTLPEMCLTSHHPIIALWLITKLILQPQISASDAALIRSVSGPGERH